MAIKWSFSMHHCFRRCQRQFLFRHIVAWPNARDPLRREAYILKQAKTVEVWRGLVVHKGIERFVMPQLEARKPIDWESVIRDTKALANRQLRFSADKRYREDRPTKTAVGDD